ncbi:head GIN domain-containing protein [uncultured Algoriphagus sp.]|uniref:head GIN domain-containing protein n=1 Tax=uncultured Algoriphagus sp. TaxID=417365 RepID=UPI00258A249A|nr:head GIN domain-containing protein [uncultured Algoriphagus sp.]
MKNLKYLSFLLMLIALSCVNRSKKEWGEELTETKSIAGVSKVSLTGAFNVHIHQGDEESMEIEGYQKTIDQLTISQENESLQIKFGSKEMEFEEGFTPEIHLTIANLEELSFDGAGNIESEGKLELNSLLIKGNGAANLELNFEANELEARLNMMGNTNFKGSAENAKILFEGMGNLDAEGLLTTNLDLRSSGMGRVSVYCTGELSLQAEGMGVVSYKGNPTVIKEEVNGLGIVNRN